MKLLIVFAAVACIFGLTSGNVIRRVRDASDSNESTDNDIEQFVAVMAMIVPALCSRNGPNNDDILLAGFQSFTECIEKVYDLNELKNKNMTSENAEEDLKSFFDEVCPTVPSAISCIEEFSTVSNVCLLADEIEQKDQIIRVAKNLINYGCNDNGAHIIDLITDDNQKCINEVGDDIQTCVEPITDKHSKDSSEETRDSYIITADDCHDFEKLEKCFTSNLDKCPTPNASRVFKDIFDILWAEIPCKNLIA